MSEHITLIMLAIGYNAEMLIKFELCRPNSGKLLKDPGNYVTVTKVNRMKCICSYHELHLLDHEPTFSNPCFFDKVIHHSFYVN